MKILVIVDEYRPNFNANSICLQNVIDELNDDVYITVISSKFNLDYNSDLQKKEKIKRYYNMYGDIYKKITNNTNTNKISKLFFRILNGIFVNYIWADINLFWYITKRRSILKDTKNEEYDLMITSSGSFSSQQLGLYIKKKKEIKWVVYLNDPLPEGSHLFRIRKNLLLNPKKQTELVFKNSDYLLLNKHLYKYYRESVLYNKYFDKMIEVDIPLVIPNTINFNKLSEIPVLVYAGALYKNIRNPEFMLSVLNELSNIMEFEVHILGSGDCDEILERYYKGNEKWIAYHGLVNKDVAKKYIDKADILLNIGNKISNQTPSKIFEYISSGKKIINFYSIETDTSLEYLKIYENSLSIKSDETNLKSLAYKIKKFIETEKMNITDAQLMKIFHKNTPTYTKQIILNIMNNN